MASYLCVDMQECIFDKTKGTVSMMNARFLEKHFLGYRKQSKLLMLAVTPREDSGCL